MTNSPAFPRPKSLPPVQEQEVKTTFQKFQNVYEEMKAEFYEIYSKPESSETQLKLSLLTNIFPKIRALANPELFFLQLRSQRYGENEPLLLNYLNEYPTAEKLLKSIKLELLSKEELILFFKEANNLLSNLEYLNSHNLKIIVEIHQNLRQRLAEVSVNVDSPSFLKLL